MRGSWKIAALGPALLAMPAAARDGIDGRTRMATAAVAIPVESRAMLMAEAAVFESAPGPARAALPGLPLAASPLIASLLLTDIEPAPRALVSYALPHAQWRLQPAALRLKERDAGAFERLSLEGTADYFRKRKTGLDARLELRIDGDEDSDVVRLGGRIAGAIRSLERR